ncbi:CS1 fimbrial subunit B flags: Precursor [Stenotrophomonas sp. YAU14A_MKIMI4_1]|uniref:CS1 fimbrial subunit B flags: Precursor n=1 Tax=Stenotrophomonas sp. YAU14A_MKIMI4_1 TaxID=2072408 RepID=UPI000D53FC6A|nr:CS1 fimbrial subunit B flags: Precursor [Stenotrophomonas sp. YAU14A_MKIMI4_1]AWH29569.1 CS1 fimbrial subunit B flags: Precursor [Stenotrophomonas sp. YAU14A_MKIMI4_1]
MKRKLTLLAILAAVMFPVSAGTPRISVGSLFDYIDADKSQFLKRVRNGGDATAYVRVEVTRMRFDENGAVTEEPVDSAAIATNQAGASGLIASPSRLIIPANGGQQATRLIFRGERKVEQYYRVRYVPVIPNDGEFALDSQQAASYKQGVDAGVNVFTGFGTVVFVPPSSPHYETQVEGLTVHNGGNATVVLENVRRCEIDRPDQCSSSVKVHVRPGQKHSMADDEKTFVRYDLREGQGVKSLEAGR